MTKQKVTLAQISDVHLPFPNWPSIGEWNVKRVLGLLNWHRGRRFVHRFEAVNLLLADMKAQAPDHIAVSGDLVNLGLLKEYHKALTWLTTLGTPDTVSVIPGNHDIYCRRDAGTDCRTLWADYMRSDAVGPELGVKGGDQFPFVRQIGPVALVGINSAHPTPPFIAQGCVGDAQLDRLTSVVSQAAAQGLLVCVMLHHPPLPGQAPDRRALVDADKMGRVIAQNPIGLVLYGHNHINAVSWVDNDKHPGGRVPVCGAASGSAFHRHKTEPLARYYLYVLTQDAGAVSIELVTRGLNDTKDGVVEIDRMQLL